MDEVILKTVSNITMKEGPTTSKGTQYHGSSNYAGKQRQPQLACGANGTRKPSVICNYCKDKGHTKDNSVCLNNKIAQDIQMQEQVMATK